MSATEALPFMPNPEELARLLASRVDPDAERMRYFGQAMMDSVCSPDNLAPQTRSLMQIMDLHKPRTLDELRTCIDAAKILTP